MRRGRALTHLGALWRVLFAAFRKQYMGFGRGLRIGAGNRKEERKVYGAWNLQAAGCKAARLQGCRPQAVILQAAGCKVAGDRLRTARLQAPGPQGALQG
jgi:hypothetical protein